MFARFARKQRGEIALTLSLVGLLISVLGIGLGAYSVRQEQANSASAQAYVYKSVLEIQDEQGNLVDWKPGMMWSNTSIGTTAKGDIKDPNQSKAILTWQPTEDQFPPHLENTTSDVTIALPGYEILEVFCESTPDSLCAETFMSPGRYTRNRLRIKKGTEVRYGWVVRPSGQATPSPTSVQPTPIPPTAIPPTGIPTAIPTPKPGIFSFRSRVELVDIDTGKVVKWEPGMRYRSRANRKEFNGDIKTDTDAFVETYTSSVEIGLRNQPTSVKLFLPGNYEIVSWFCEDLSGTACEGTSYIEQSRSIEGITIQKDASVKYGWKVRKTSAPACAIKTDSCAPRNFIVESISEDGIFATWEGSQQCSARDEIDPHWLYVKNSKGQIVCSNSSHFENALCILGSDNDKRADRTSQEFRSKLWTVGESYTASVFLEKEHIPSCVSKEVAVKLPFTPTAFPTIQPTATPTPAPQNQGESYNTRLLIIDDVSGQPIPWEAGIRYVSHSPLGTRDGDIKTGTQAYIDTHTPSVSPDIDGKTATVAVQLPGTYRAVDTFCRDKRGTSCASAIMDISFSTIWRIGIQRGADVEYGIRVARTGFPACQLDDDECKPRSLLVSSMTETTAKVMWGVPFSCQRHYNMHTSHDIVQIRNSKNQVVCSVLGKLFSAQCRPGFDKFGPVDEQSDEWKQKKFLDDDYTVDVQLVNPFIPSCKSQSTSYAIPKTVASESCQFLGGNPQAKEKIVLLPVGFEGRSSTQIQTSMSELVTGIRKTNLTKYEGDVGYYMHRYIGRDGDYGCQKLSSPIDDVVKKRFTCSPYLDALQRTRECSGDTTAIVVEGKDWDVYFGYAFRSMNFAVFNVSDHTVTGNSLALTFWHELGHALAGLFDEYWAENQVGSEEHLSVVHAHAPNCSRQIPSSGTCKWGNIAGCFAGCDGVTNLYRPSENGLMNQEIGDPSVDGIFNKPSLDAWDTYFTLQNQFSLLANPDFVYKNSLAIHLEQDRSGELLVQSVKLLDTYPLRAQKQSVGDYITVRLLSSDSEELFETTEQLHFDNPHDKEPAKPRETITLFLPYSKEARGVEIRDAEGDVIRTIMLSDFDIGSVTTHATGSLCGNAVCDAGLGESAQSCRADCGAHLTKSEIERSDLDKNGFVNGIDLSLLTAEDVYQKTSGGDIDGDTVTNALDYSILLRWMGNEYPLPRSVE